MVIRVLRFDIGAAKKQKIMSPKQAEEKLRAEGFPDNVIPNCRAIAGYDESRSSVP